MSSYLMFKQSLAHHYEHKELNNNYFKTFPIAAYQQANHVANALFKSNIKNLCHALSKPS